MITTSMYVYGQIANIVTNSYEEVITSKAQFYLKSEKKGIEVIEVKLTDSTISVKEGDIVNIPVTISSMSNNSKIFYKQNGKIEIVKA